MVIQHLKDTPPFFQPIHNFRLYLGDALVEGDNGEVATALWSSESAAKARAEGLAGLAMVADKFSERQSVIVERVLRNHETAKEIAESIGCSHETVRRDIVKVLSLLGALVLLVGMAIAFGSGDDLKRSATGDMGNETQSGHVPADIASATVNTLALWVEHRDDSNTFYGMLEREVDGLVGFADQLALSCASQDRTREPFLNAMNVMEIEYTHSTQLYTVRGATPEVPLSRLTGHIFAIEIISAQSIQTEGDRAKLRETRRLIGERTTYVAKTLTQHSCISGRTVPTTMDRFNDIPSLATEVLARASDARVTALLIAAYVGADSLSSLPSEVYEALMKTARRATAELEGSRMVIEQLKESLGSSYEQVVLEQIMVILNGYIDESCSALQSVGYESKECASSFPDRFMPDH